LIKKNFLYGLSFLLAKKYAEVAKQRLKGQSFDILVASCGAPAIALLETIMPFGANFETLPPREIVEERKKSDRCKLLFVGTDWQRKGGDIAFETRGDGYASGTHCVVVLLQPRFRMRE